MSAAKAGDKFANIAHLAVTETAANTLTFAQLNMATSLMERKFAIIIHRAETYIGVADYNKLLLADDALIVALSLSDRLTSIADLSQPEILFNVAFSLKFATAIGEQLLVKPHLNDFNAMPGGGILVPGDRLHIGIAGTSLASACSATMRIYYTVRDLSVEDYWELIEARRVMTT